jgi:hypothetical protein
MKHSGCQNGDAVFFMISGTHEKYYGIKTENSNPNSLPGKSPASSFT